MYYNIKNKGHIIEKNIIDVFDTVDDMEYFEENKLKKYSF